MGQIYKNTKESQFHSNFSSTKVYRALKGSLKAYGLSTYQLIKASLSMYRIRGTSGKSDGRKKRAISAPAGDVQ